MSMDPFTEGLSRYLPPGYLARVAEVTLGIAGCGGIGSNCAHNLVRCGFQRFLLVDDDIVEPSNLNRQFYFSDQTGQAKVDMLKTNLLAISRRLDIQAVKLKITEDNIGDLFNGCAVVVEAFDEPADKKMLLENCFHPDRLIVSVSGIGGYGETDRIVTRKVNDNLFIVGDFNSEISESLHPYAPAVTLAAAKQADIVFNHYMQYFDRL